MAITWGLCLYLLRSSIYIRNIIYKETGHFKVKKDVLNAALSTTTTATLTGCKHSLVKLFHKPSFCKRNREVCVCVCVSLLGYWNSPGIPRDGRTAVC